MPFKKGQTRNDLNNFFDEAEVTPEQTRRAALALIGAKLNGDPTLCGLEDVMGALAVREVILGASEEEEEPQQTTGAKPLKVIRPTKKGQYDFCATCGKETLHLYYMVCESCGNKYGH